MVISVVVLFVKGKFKNTSFFGGFCLVICLCFCVMEFDSVGWTSLVVLFFGIRIKWSFLLGV